MALHILKMTDGVDNLLKDLQGRWAKDIGRDPAKIQDYDIVFLLGHGGGESTVQFVEKWNNLTQVIHPKNKVFILLMCGQGNYGGSAQVAELIVSDGAHSVIYCEEPIMLIRVYDMPEDLGVGNWADLFRKEDGEMWKMPNHDAYWHCFSNEGGPSLGLG